MDPVQEAIAAIDRQVGNYGFSSQQGYGLDGMLPTLPGRGPAAPQSPVNYSVNPQIAAATAGASTLQITVSAEQTGTGSANDYNPIFFFGGNAFSGASRGYNAVIVNANLTTAVAVANGKNVVTFKYADPADDTKYTTYTVTLSTAGDYVFVLNGTTRYQSSGMQIALGDTSKTEQLSTPISTFELDDFGKATSNDLTTPEDLYQQKTGLFIRAPFFVSRREGLTVNVLDEDGFSVSYYMYLRKVG